MFNPISNYGEVNYYLKYIWKTFQKKKNIEYLIIRFPNVVGPPLTHGVIYDFCKKILNQKYLKVLGNGSQKKPYVYVQ